MYVEQLNLVEQNVGYGTLGTQGTLGYDGLQISVQHRKYEHALSAHAPAILVFELDQRFDEFSCQVAINDDAGARNTSADFIVYADNQVVASIPSVHAGDPPQQVHAIIRGSTKLKLVTQTTQWAFCHSLWLDPEVRAFPAGVASVEWKDALSRVKAQKQLVTPQTELCVATVVSQGYASLLDSLLASLQSQGVFEYASVVVFNVGSDVECGEIIAKYGARNIPCKLLGRKNQTIKSVLYSVASLVNANKFICLDADMLVLEDIRPVFDALDAHPPDAILVVRDAFMKEGNLLHQLCSHYRGESSDFSLLLRHQNNEGQFNFIVNDGFFAGTRRALLGIESIIRNMSHAASWMDHYPDHGWRNQFIFNLALAQLRCQVELDPRYNLQLHMHDVQLNMEEMRPEAIWQGRPAHILHFCGWGRNKYPELRERFARGNPG